MMRKVIARVCLHDEGLLFLGSSHDGCQQIPRGEVLKAVEDMT
jgi:hypothetical protein